jgi:putative component of membrane protein insertase Oxa1/YidC/SpoIIIJ protein YidD
MNVLNYHIFTPEAKAEPAPRIFERPRQDSGETTNLRDHDAVIGPVADAPSRWRAMALGSVIAVVVFGVFFLKIEILFSRNTPTCSQYDATTVVEANFVAGSGSEGNRCPNRGCQAITTESRSELEKATPPAKPESGVREGVSPKPRRNVLGGHGAPENVRRAHRDGSIETAGKFVGGCDTGISARVELTVKVSLGRREPGRIPTTSE